MKGEVLDTGEARKQFTFYRSYYDALLPLPRETQAAVLLAVCAYALYETEPEGLSPVESATFNLIRPTLDSGRRKAMAGRMGGEVKQSASKPEANGKQTASKPQANRKQTGSEGEKEREKEGEIEIEKEIENECYNPLPPSGGSEGISNDDLYPLADFLSTQYPETRNDGWARLWKALRSAHLCRQDVDKIKENLPAWKRSEQWNKCGGQYIPMLSNWITKGIWKTKPATAAPSGASGELGEAELDAIRQVMEE